MINKKHYVILAAGLLSAGALSACGSGKATSASQSTASSLIPQSSGVDEASVTFILANLDMDDGRLEYDVEFYSDKTEYEISVDAYTGDITEFSGETYR